MELMKGDSLEGSDDNPIPHVKSSRTYFQDFLIQFCLVSASTRYLVTGVSAIPVVVAGVPVQ